MDRVRRLESVATAAREYIDHIDSVEESNKNYESLCRACTILEGCPAEEKTVPIIPPETESFPEREGLALRDMGVVGLILLALFGALFYIALGCFDEFTGQEQRVVAKPVDTGWRELGGGLEKWENYEMTCVRFEGSISCMRK